MILSDEDYRIHTTTMTEKGGGASVGERGRAKNRGDLDLDDKTEKRNKSKANRSRESARIMRTGGEKIKTHKFQAIPSDSVSMTREMEE